VRRRAGGPSAALFRPKAADFPEQGGHFPEQQRLNCPLVLRWAGNSGRTRHATSALQAYAALTTSAARGAVRDVTQVARTR